MMAYKGSKSTRDNFGKFIHQFQPETKTLIRKLERILIKLYRQNVSLLFNQTRLYIYIYIYIYMRESVSQKKAFSIINCCIYIYHKLPIQMYPWCILWHERHVYIYTSSIFNQFHRQIMQELYIGTLVMFTCCIFQFTIQLKLISSFSLFYQISAAYLLAFIEHLLCFGMLNFVWSQRDALPLKYTSNVISACWPNSKGAICYFFFLNMLYIELYILDRHTSIVAAKKEVWLVEW